MSIAEALEARVEDGSLVLVPPILGGDGVREVYATRDVFAQLEPTSAASEFVTSAGHMRAWLDGFSRGRRIVVGLRRSRTCDMKRLDPSGDEVWEIRKQDPPSVRLFGRFVDKDIFVVTNLELVSNLFSVEWFVRGFAVWPIWKREIRNCKAAWRVLFHAYEPHTGSNLNDYLSNADPEGSW